MDLFMIILRSILLALTAILLVMALMFGGCTKPMNYYPQAYDQDYSTQSYATSNDCPCQTLINVKPAYLQPATAISSYTIDSKKQSKITERLKRIQRKLK